ncbi:MAG: GNAT family N-acetyltransferase [Rhizobiales bacterium]|nr:GNAT family N-acetyltransferase [Hyphomicrobiales bacterium]
MAGRLETARLILRPLAEGDAPVLVRELNDMAIARNTARIPHPYHLDDALDFLRFVDRLAARSRVAGVEEKTAPGELVGVISYEWSEAQDDAELGYWYSQRVWGRGIGSEAARAMVDDAFERAGHDRVVACYHNGNTASARILEKLGFEVVGPCSSYSKAQGREVPVTNLSLSRDRWQARRMA